MAEMGGLTGLLTKPGMEPSVPPPPICQAFWFQSVGIETLKLIGSPVPTGLMAPWILQYSGAVLAMEAFTEAETRTAWVIVAPPVGRPISEASMVFPTISR